MKPDKTRFNQPELGPERSSSCSPVCIFKEMYDEFTEKYLMGCK
jgi:hypothetical protein